MYRELGCEVVENECELGYVVYRELGCEVVEREWGGGVLLLSLNN